MITSDSLYTFDDITKQNSGIKGISSAKDFSSNHFRYYTSVDGANKILEGRNFRIRPIKEMNDVNEADLYGNLSNLIHPLCFSNASKESIPMWYLYSGIGGKGVCLDITPGKMLEFIQKPLEVFSDATMKNRLIEGKDIEVLFGWIVYWDNGRYYYRNKKCDYSSFSSVNKSQYFFFKNYPWNYEAEFRIAILNKKEKMEYVYLRIDDALFRNINILLAPEISECDKEKIVSMPGFKSHACSKYLKSELDIKMQLVERNVSAITDWIMSDNDSIDHTNNIKKISTAIDMKFKS